MLTVYFLMGLLSGLLIASLIFAVAYELGLSRSQRESLGHPHDRHFAVYSGDRSES